jgi:hypothetical protein
MEREKRQEFVERTKNLLTAAESQGTSEKSQRSTGGGAKKVIYLIRFFSLFNRLIISDLNMKKKKSLSMILLIFLPIRKKSRKNEPKDHRKMAKENHRSKFEFPKNLK